MVLIRPALFVLSAPSGNGKTSLVKVALERLKFLTLSVSTTTRAPRAGEVEGKDYHFTSTDDFKASIAQGEFLEWAEVYGNHYGTSKKRVEEARAHGYSVLLDIDVQGAVQLQQLKDFSARYVFIKPPSLDELKRRLEGRGTETPETLAKRLGNAAHELTFQERYDFVILNDDLEAAEDAFMSLLIEQSLDLQAARRAGAEEVCRVLCSDPDDRRVRRLVENLLENAGRP